MTTLRRELAAVLAAVAGLMPSVAEADGGPLNLHVDLGAGLPVAGYAAPRGDNDHSSNFGFGTWLAIDYHVVGPFAIEVIGGGGHMWSLITANPDRTGGVNPPGFEWYTAGLGARLRLLDDHAGYRNDEGGNARGNLWLSAHVGYQRWMGNQVGLDAALGYEWSVRRPTQIGVFVRGMMGFDGDGRPWVPGEKQLTAAAFAGLNASFELIQHEGEVHTPPPPPPPAPADTDGDGITDDVDTCVSEAEDVDGFQDTDGCPDPDNDGDGIADATDACPSEAEDADGFQDTDGCPDPDNDGDGVADADDRCPTEAGPASEQGCPLPDGDGDGVPDREDNCPTEPGTVEFHGCAERQLVVMTGDRLEILEKVMFRTGSASIDRRSNALLDNVARVLAAHPEITRLRVEGHTDSKGNAQRNQQLSQRRAQAVVTYLVRRGHVDASRLVAEGFGSSRPVVENATTEAEYEQNRRVEFHIVRE
ncbi:MAG: OmpA family protein [Polyangiales bacterium]